MKQVLKRNICILLAATTAASLFTGCSGQSESNVSEENSAESQEGVEEEGYEVEQNGQGFYAYLDYAEKQEDNISLEFVLGGVNTTFADEIDADQITFDGDLANAGNAVFTTEEDGTLATLTAELPAENLDAENLSLEGSITLAEGTLLDSEENPLDEPCCLTNIFTFSDSDKAIGEEIQSENRTDWTVSDKGIQLIEKCEDCHLNAYKAPSGVWTIGYGHTEGVKQGDILRNREEAETLLKEDLKKYESVVNSFIRKGDIKFDLNQNQFDALVSFTYNCGTYNLERLVSGKDADTIAKKMLLYNRAGGQKLQSLTNRRKAEQELFLNPYK